MTQDTAANIDKIFKAYDVRSTYPEPLNEDAAYRVGFGTGTFLKKQSDEDSSQLKLADTVLVSRDMRPSSPGLQAALSEGIRDAGMNVIDLGMCDTSFIYFAINHLGAAGGVQVTASHNPIGYNGMKISGQLAKPIGANTGLNAIRDIARTCKGRGGDGAVEHIGKETKQDLWAEYRKHVLQFLTPLKKPTKVFIDASNGMAGEMVPRVFDGVENLEIIKLNFEITGEFAHDPNPLVAENMVPTQEGVREHGCVMGACFDGDADRCMITDDQGDIVGCDLLTALMAEHFAAIDQKDPAHKGTTITYDLRSSKVVEERIRELGATPRKSRVGHVFMKALLRETGGIFGGELSGHFYFRDNFYADSGAIAFASVLSVLNAHDEPLSKLIKPYTKYPQSGEMNFKVEDKQGVMDMLREKYAGQAEVDDLDGVTIDAFETAGWWFNVRPSNTEPLLRFNGEAKDKATLKTMLEEVTPHLGEHAEGH